MVNPRVGRSFIDRQLPDSQDARKLLTPTRGESSAVFIVKEGENARVYYPVDSTNEVVAPAQPGAYPESGSGGVVPVLLAADGRISQVLPPLSVDLSAAHGVGDAGEAILETRSLAFAHDEHLAEIDVTITEIDEHNRDVVDPFIRETDHALTVELPAAKQAAAEAQSKALEALARGDQGVSDAADARAAAGTAAGKAEDALYVGNLAAELARGMVWVDETEPPFDSRVNGQVWIKINADGQMEGIYRLQDAAAEVAVWDQYTTVTGLLIVPGENGVPTIIDQNGVVVGQIVSDAITTGVLAAASVGAKQLIIGDISRAHLDEAVDGVLADAEEIASRVVIDPSSITISRSVVGSQGALTALRLEATKMDFIVDGKSVAYIDSDRNLMSIGNVNVRDSLQIGEHQVRRLGQGGITIFQHVGV